MGQSTVRTPGSVGPIRNSDARRICALSGLETARQKVVKLQNIRDGLNRSIRELEGQRRKEEMGNKALLVARFTKLTCDAFIGMAAALAQAVLPKQVGDEAELVEKGYNTAAPLLQAVSTAASGGKVERFKTATTVVRNSAYLITDKVVGKEGYRILAETTVAKAEVVHAAMNEENKTEIFKPAVSYIYDLHATLADLAANEKPEDTLHRPKVGYLKGFAAFLKIAKTAFEYHEQLGKAFEEMENGSLDSNRRFILQKTNVTILANRVAKQIDILEQYIASCEIELRQAPNPLPYNRP